MAKLITPKVATALQTASVFVNSQMAKMHSTVQATRDNEITIKLMSLTNLGLSMPFLFFCEFSVGFSIVWLRSLSPNLPDLLLTDFLGQLF